MRKILLTGNGGFTLLEILVTISVLAFGFLQLFLIFFNAGAAVRHVGNRLSAVILMENAAWEGVEGLRPVFSKGTHKYEGAGLEEKQKFDISIETEKIKGFQKLYKFKIKAFWLEGKRAVSMQSEKLVRTRFK